jgi:hypothetical protein
MRFTSQINSGKNVDQVVMRALQLSVPFPFMFSPILITFNVSASSHPQGPVYLWGRREAMEEEVEDSIAQRSAAVQTWSPKQETTIPKSGLYYTFVC